MSGRPSPAPSARSLGELPPDALLRVEDIGRFLGCSARTVQRAGIPAIQLRPRVRRYFVRDVLEWLDRQRNGAGRRGA